ncbi:MAG: MerR family transcriptional regulator [Desulfobulbaceae bacterium]|nr:MerR family transcriptional regulator [Desulfobulbaceae bacterium]
MIDEKKAIFTIGVAAQMLDVHPRTLRIYEQEGLVKPLRKGKWRYFTMNNIRWIECLREMIHVHGISIPAIKKLLLYTPCWNISDCSREKRESCVICKVEPPIVVKGKAKRQSRSESVAVV